jgi:hypothetical protein
MQSLRDDSSSVCLSTYQMDHFIKRPWPVHVLIFCLGYDNCSQFSFYSLLNLSMQPQETFDITTCDLSVSSKTSSCGGISEIPFMF